MVEEPGPADDVLARRRIVERSPVPVVGDESCTRPGEVARLLLDRSCDLVSIKTARTGFTESARILGLCEGLGAGVLVGSQMDGTIGTLAGVSLAAAHRVTAERPAELSAFLEMADDLLAEPPEILEGRMAPPERPGLGVVLDREKLAWFRTDH
jgi:L-alanine-DL-glutamate epimerase-like enolase superfamily enzyme